MDAGACVTVDGTHIVNWLVGQVRNDSQDGMRMLAYARKIGADEAEFKKTFQDVPVMSTKQLEKISQSVFMLANLLSTTAYQNIQ